jgi:hypothetical protein
MLPPYDSRLRPARGKHSSAIPAGPAQRFRRHLGHKNAHPAADAESTAALCESKKNSAMFGFHRIDRTGFFQLSTVPASFDALNSERLREDAECGKNLFPHPGSSSSSTIILNSSTTFAPERLPAV